MCWITMLIKKNMKGICQKKVLRYSNTDELFSYYAIAKHKRERIAVLATTSYKYRAENVGDDRRPITIYTAFYSIICFVFYNSQSSMYKTDDKNTKFVLSRGK